MTMTIKPAQICQMPAIIHIGVRKFIIIMKTPKTIAATPAAIAAALVKYFIHEGTPLASSPPPPPPGNIPLTLSMFLFFFVVLTLVFSSGLAFTFHSPVTVSFL